MESTDSSSGSQPQPQLPPGFRFHPTDEELVVHYLKKKATSSPLPVTIIAEVDLYKFDPWELPGKANFGEQEWYFFSPRDRKYPNGARPNRAATSGYWKATGTDKPILSTSTGGSGGAQKVGVKKALVFYGGKPPKGIKTNWIMHEYRLTDGSSTTCRPPNSHDTKKNSSLRLDDWVLCRIYKKNNNNTSSSTSTTTIHTEPCISRQESVDAGPLRPLHQPAAAIGPGPQQQQQLTLRSAPHHLHRAPTNYTALLDSDDTFFEGLLTPAAGDHQLCNPAATAQSRPFPSPYWCDSGAAAATAAGNIHGVLPPPAKRFQASSSSSNSTTNNNNNNSSSNGANNTTANEGHAIAELLHQLPQSAGSAYHHNGLLLAPLGDTSNGAIGQQYQLPSINWGT